jgi:lipoyl(octanoyl) transferase
MSEGSPRPGTPTLDVRRLGRLAYADGLGLQEELVRARREGHVPDTLLLLEHPHVLTLGSGATNANVLASEAEREERGIELFHTGRGGDVTYHGPGQLIGYPILHLDPERRDLHRYLRDLEAVLIDTLADFGLAGERIEGLTGVWVDGRKLAAIGIRVSSGWITSHGFALNVNTDLSYFDTIVPCGIRDRAVGSLADRLGHEVEISVVEDAVEAHFRARFGRDGRIGVGTPPRS